MALDINSSELQLLLRQFENGNTVLFAGAGYSLGATNSLGSEPPLGGELAKILAEEAGWKYNGEELPIVYNQVRNRLGNQGLNTILTRLYRGCNPAAWHIQIAQLFWYRIYTTNVDDVIQNSYNTGAIQRLDTIVSPSSYQENHSFYERVQCIHLHGSITDLDKPFTFTLEEFAQLTATPNPWYQALADDMQSKTFVFVGARLNEVPFYHYLQLRTSRNRDVPESRAKAFLVAPNISPIWRKQYESQNFVVVDAKAEDFFQEIIPMIKERVPERTTVIKNHSPLLIAAIEANIINTQSEILKHFEFVNAAGSPKTSRNNRTYFFEGAEPTWEDIFNEVDAKREITDDILQKLLAEPNEVQAFILFGQAGSGKSTLMKRLAFEIAKAGFSVYLTRTIQRLDETILRDLINLISNRRIFIFIDNGKVNIQTIDNLLHGLPKQTLVTFVIADRPHILLPRLQRARDLKSLPPKMLEVPQLNRVDCESIIEKLDEFKLLGTLKNKPRYAQLQEFLVRSKKQLLVAMKEATSGRGFDYIIDDEYRTLASDNARLAYAIACLVYIHGAPIRQRHLLACLDGTDVEKANTLKRDLNGVVVSYNENFVSPRHKVIADRVVTGAAPVNVKEEAVRRLLTQISADIEPSNIKRRSPEYVAYRGLINFDNMLDLFGPNYDLIESIYRELRDYYSEDFLFWLQYGRAEVHFDNFSIAENYLNQSLSIRDAGNFQAKHYRGVLYLKRALDQETSALAAEDAQLGEEILREQIRERGDKDAYPYAALVKHKLQYLLHYPSSKLTSELEELKQLAEIGLTKYPFDDAMKDARDRVLRAYLMTQVADDDES